MVKIHIDTAISNVAVALLLGAIVPLPEEFFTVPASATLGLFGVDYLGFVKGLMK